MAGEMCVWDSRDAMELPEPVRTGGAGRAGTSACAVDGDERTLRGEEANTGESIGRRGERGGRLRDAVDPVERAGEGARPLLPCVSGDSTTGVWVMKGRGEARSLAMAP